MPLQRTELYPFFQKHSIPTEAHFKELIDSMLNLEDDGVSKPPDDPLSIKAVGTEEGLMNFYRDNGGVNESTWQFKQKPGGKAGLSIHDVAADATPSRLFIESGTGNVGIGTTEPGEMLEVAGIIKAEGVKYDDGTVQTTAATSGLWTQNGLKIHYNDGNVGIGTTDPGAKLHILGSNPVLQLDHNVANQGTATIQFTHVAGGSNQRKVAMISEATGSWCRGHLHLAVNIKGDTSDVAIGDAKLTIRGDTGNVGIGTTAPATPLAIRGNGGTYDVGITQAQVGGTATMEFTTADAANKQATRLLLRGGSDAADIEFYSGARGAEQVTMYLEGTTGNVGIGTATPGSSKLMVANSATDYADIRFSGSGMGQLEFVGWGSGWNINAKTNGKHLYMNRDAGSNSNVLVGRNGKELFVRGSDGNVGIGTTAPGAKLEVKGGVTILEQEAWQTPTFQNGWVNFSSGYNTAGYFKDSQGVVHLKGLVKNGKIASTIFTLPVGYRPAARELHVVCTSSNVSGRLDVLTDGQVRAEAGSASWFSLDGITFRAK